jgi:DNA-binding NarL/FixJ family response regulator
MARKRYLQVVIADDHELIRRGFRDLIREDPAFKVVAEYRNGREALAGIESLEPDLAVLDVAMPGLNGLQVTEEIHRRHLPVQPIILTMHDNREFFEEAMRCGVRGYVLKDRAVSELVECLHAVGEGQFYISASISNYLVQFLQTQATIPELRLLTRTEIRILKLVAQARTSKEIADQLFISPRTVETHRHNICRKLNLNGSHKLLQFAMEHQTSLR